MFPTKKKRSLSVIRDVSTRSTNWKQKNFFQPSRWHTVMLKQRGRMFAYIMNQNGIFCSLIVDELSSIPTHTQRHRHCSQCCSRQSGKRRLSVSLWLTFRSATGTLATWGLRALSEPGGGLGRRGYAGVRICSWQSEYLNKEPGKARRRRTVRWRVSAPSGKLIRWENPLLYMFPEARECRKVLWCIVRSFQFSCTDKEIMHRDELWQRCRSSFNLSDP